MRIKYLKLAVSEPFDFEISFLFVCIYFYVFKGLIDVL